MNDDTGERFFYDSILWEGIHGFIFMRISSVVLELPEIRVQLPPPQFESTDAHF